MVSRLDRIGRTGTLAIAIGVGILVPPAPGQTSRPAASQPASRPADAGPNPAAPGFDREGSDVEAVRLADAVMAKMGGRAAWDRTRFIAWNFFGRRAHVWDRHTGRIRIEGTRREGGQPYVILMNVHGLEGRVWEGGEEVTDPEERRERLEQGLGMWINDSYWLLMPYKLKDTGVTLKYVGARTMQDERPAQVLSLTFKDVGRTPQNKYHVYVAADSGLVEQWDFFAQAADGQPRFSTPWRQWKRHGGIMLSGDRGERKLTDIAVFDELADEVFTSPEPVTLPPPAAR